MKEMSLVEHLEELRKRIIRVMIVLVVSFGICYGQGEHIAEFLLLPLREALKNNAGQIIYIGLLDKVLSQFQLAFWSSIILSSPLWFREAWLFIRPGLHSHEIKAIRPFIWVGFVLFVAGICFGYFLVFPLTFDVLMNFGVSNIEANLNLKDYLVLSTKVLVFLGLVFQLPNVMLILGYMGLVTKYSLRSWRRYVYVLFAIISSILTPPDVITMLGLWAPLACLYEIGIWGVAFFVHPFLAKNVDN